MLHINNLPNEILFGIFKLLSPQDLKTAVLTCKLWKDLGEDPSLWRWSVVKLVSSEDFPKLNIPRLQLLQEIKIAHALYCYNDSVEECHWRKNGMLEMFKVILEIPTITRIKTSGFDECEGLAAVEPTLLASVFNRLEKLELMRKLAPEQIEVLFTAMAKNTSLKLLDIEHFGPLSSLGPGLFASAISNVDEVILNEGLGWDRIMNQIKYKMEALFSVIRIEERPLTKLTVDASLICGIDPDVLGTALTRLEEVTVTSYHDWLRLAQVNAILKNVTDGESKMKRLMLEGLDFRVFGKLNIYLVERTEVKFGKFYTMEWSGVF